MKKLLLIICLSLSQFNFAQNNSFTFNGIDQWVQTYTGQPNIAFTTQNFTIEAWVKPATFVPGTGVFEHTIVGNDNWNAAGNYGYVLRTGGSRKLDFTFGQGTNWYSVVSTNPVFTVGEWTHVAVVRNGTSFKLYANGMQVGQQTITQNIAPPQANLRIAENGNGSDRKFNGSLDEIKIWNTARTVAEVRNDLAATATPLPAELVVYYKMDQTSGQDVISETSIDLFAKYTGSPNVNSATGFFRTYVFQIAGNWYNNANYWKDNFEPNNLITGDIIDVNVDCNFNLSFFDLPIGCTLNVQNGATLTMNQAQEIIFNNYGTLNIYDTFLFPRTLGNDKFENFGSVNIAVGSSFKSANIINLQSGSIMNNNGYLGNIDTTFYCEFNNYGGTLTNFSGSTIDISRFFNYGNFINYGTSTSVLLSNGSINYPNATVSNMSGSITINKRLLNEATINNYANLNLLNDGVTVHKNTSTGVINNYNFQSVFRVYAANASFENEGTFAYQNQIENKGTFTNKSGATLKALNGGIGGSVRQFENFAGATFNNQGTYILGENFNNSGTHSNTGTHSGNGTFNGSVYINPANANLSPSDNTGSGIGTLSFFNGLTNNGNVNIQINGLNAGSQHDKINVTGTATISGILNASRLNNYIPPIGTTEFTIISATAVSGTFATVNLPAASQGVVWSVVYTNDSVKIKSVVTALTNTTIINGCLNYTWPINNQTYTVAGTYFFNNGTNITNKLILTFATPSDNTTIQNSCNDFFWANTNQLYTQSGIYTGTTSNNCVTEKLNLTITPSSDIVTSISACDNYTWNGITYSTSGIFTGTTNNCVTEKLNLTITPTSENTTFENACNNYTWATNGQTYTNSGLYTSTTNCVTQKLNLTIFPITTSSLTVTACNAYAWPDSEDIINTSGIYTYIDNCETKTLNLTIDQGPTITGNSDQNLNINATLSNIIVSPTNVVWYNNFEDALTGTSPLLNTQVVTNGTTYYAVANDGTCPSLPFAVTVTTSNLANENFELKDLKYYPNPTSDILNINYSEIIIDIEVSNVLGQKLIIQKNNKNNYKLDLSSLPNAAYFVKITTFDKEKTIKVLKQ